MARNDGHDTATDPGGLLVAARAGRGEAWNELVARYSGHLTKIAASYRIHDDVQDVVQTTWLRLFENGGAIREPDAVLGWLRTTVRRECLRTVERRRAECLVDTRGTEWADRCDPPVEDVVTDRLVRADSRRRAEHAICALPPRRRQLLRLLSQPRPVSYREISDRLSIPVGSIGPTRARAIGQLRRALSGDRVGEA